MIAPSTDSLPASISSRLKDEQHQALAEATRDKRLDVLAKAFGVTEQEALSQLAQAAGLDVATNLETDPGARGLLPARLVYDYQIIPIRFGPRTEENPS